MTDTLINGPRDLRKPRDRRDPSLPEGRGDAEVLDTLAALTHSIREQSRFLGLDRLDALADAVDRIVHTARDNGGTLSPEVRAIVFEATGRIKRFLETFETTAREPDDSDGDLIARLNRIAGIGANTDAPVVRDVAERPDVAGRPESTLRKAGRSLLKAGLARTLQRALQRLVPNWVFDINRLEVCETDLSEWWGAAPAPEWRYRWATPEDTDLLLSRGLSPAEIERFFAHGARGTVLERDGELIANNWVVPNHWTAFGWIDFALAPTELYGASSFVAPAYRGHRIHHQTRSFAYGTLAAQGYTRVLTLIETLNRSSLRASAHKPRRSLGTLSYIRFLGLVVLCLNGTWRAGFWSRRRPFTVTHDLLCSGAGSRTTQPAPTLGRARSVR
ncbi:MAG: hypothetical protein HQ511_05700 [Rhodospirillales bacterium]|nr:hypothetical protein [Rhodospirillales bacterium]